MMGVEAAYKCLARFRMCGVVVALAPAYSEDRCLGACVKTWLFVDFSSVVDFLYVDLFFLFEYPEDDAQGSYPDPVVAFPAF